MTTATSSTDSVDIHSGGYNIVLKNIIFAIFYIIIIGCTGHRSCEMSSIAIVPSYGFPFHDPNMFADTNAGAGNSVMPLVGAVSKYPHVVNGMYYDYAEAQLRRTMNLAFELAGTRPQQQTAAVPVETETQLVIKEMRQNSTSSRQRNTHRFTYIEDAPDKL